jgi:hypothetical protein
MVEYCFGALYPTRQGPSAAPMLTHKAKPFKES